MERVTKQKKRTHPRVDKKQYKPNNGMTVFALADFPLLITVDKEDKRTPLWVMSNVRF